MMPSRLSQARCDRSLVRSLIWLALLAAGCGHAGPPAEREPRAPEPAPAAAPPASEAPGATADAELARAEAELERARAELNESLPRAFASAPASAPAAAAGAAPEKPKDDVASSAPSAPRADADTPRPVAKGRARAEADVANEAEERSEKKQVSPCERSCKAFVSLERAKSAICRLDTPGGARCGRAEDIFRDAQSRVASCACQR